MSQNEIMDAKDAVYGSLAECFVTIGSRRYNFMNLIDFESKWDVNITDVKILGKVGMGHKAAGGKARHITTSLFSVKWLTTIRKREKCRISKFR